MRSSLLTLTLGLLLAGCDPSQPPHYDTTLPPTLRIGSKVAVTYGLGGVEYYTVIGVADDRNQFEVHLPLIGDAWIDPHEARQIVVIQR